MTEKPNSTRDLICEVLSPIAQERGAQLTEQTDLGADLALDSMKIMEVMLELEDSLDISIPQNILPKVRTLGDLVRELDALKTS